MRQPESEAEAGVGGEGTSVGAVKRGLSLEAAAAGQDVKRFRTAAGAASTVSSVHPVTLSSHTVDSIYLIYDTQHSKQLTQSS